MAQDISMWFGGLPVTYVHIEASTIISAPLQAQHPLMVGYNVSTFLSQLDHKALIQASHPLEWFFTSSTGMNPVAHHSHLQSTWQFSIWVLHGVIATPSHVCAKKTPRVIRKPISRTITIATRLLHFMFLAPFIFSQTCSAPRNSILEKWWSCKSA